MKFTVERQAILKTLGRVQRVTRGKTTSPILSNIKLVASGDHLTVTGTDLDIEVKDICSATVESAGSTTAPAQMLLDIVKKMPDDVQIVMEQIDDAVMTVKAGKSRFKIQCLPVSDYPDLTMDDTNQVFQLGAGVLKTMFEKVAFAISTEETRYYLNGIYFHVEGDSALRAVATDGHRLATRDIDIPDGVQDSFGIIVPRKTVSEVLRLAGEVDGDITIALSNSKIRFSVENTVLTSKLIDGTFPDYKRVIPQNNNRIATVDAAELKAAIERVSTVASERGKAVKFTFSEGALNLNVTNPESGTAEEELAAEYSGEPFEIGFNSQYAGEIIKVLGGERVSIRMNDPGSPTILVGDEAAHTCVLMPMRV